MILNQKTLKFRLPWNPGKTEYLDDIIKYGKDYIALKQD